MLAARRSVSGVRLAAGPILLLCSILMPWPQCTISSMSETPASLFEHPIHLGLGATAEVEPAFTGEMAWYEGYTERHGDDGQEGRLVSIATFTEPWSVWEMHPNGAEVVLCTAGELELVQEIDGEEVLSTLTAGQYAINQPGTWHTANASAPATALFITAGEGTEHRPR